MTPGLVLGGDRPTIRRRERLRGYDNGAAGWIPMCAGWRGTRSLHPNAWDQRPLQAGSGNWHRTAGRAGAAHFGSRAVDALDGAAVYLWQFIGHHDTLNFARGGHFTF